MKSLKIRYKIYTLGCKVNQYDSGDIERRLVMAGFVPAAKNADVAVINTCAVTKTAISKCKRTVNKARRENPGAKIVIAGCWPRVYRNETESSGADLVVRGGKKQTALIDTLKTKLGIAGKKHDSRNSYSRHSHAFADSHYTKSRYFLKIQDGCEQFCSYCIIPYARGKPSSRPEKEVLEEVRGVIRAGYREIVLCGIHLGAYGHERGDGADLTGLLAKITRIRGLGRVRLSSIEVTEVTDKLMALMAKDRKMCRHLHVPLQSGSGKILKLMNRPYAAGYFADRVKKIRAAMPDIAITTDIIVGFPGETESDFMATYDLAKKLEFSRLHVFPFSPHEKAPAAKLPGRVGEEEVKARTEKLKKLGAKLAARYKKKFAGKKLEVVVEKIEGDKYTGKTEYYFDVVFKTGGKKLKRGDLTVVKNY